MKLPIETDRLLLREANLDDDRFIYKLLNNPTWIEHIGDREIVDLQAARNYIQKSLLDSYTAKGFGLYVMIEKKNDEQLGLCGFVKRDELEHVDIGFAILPHFAEQGYTFEAASALLDQSNFKVVYGITDERNLSSRKLLTKLGLKPIKKIQFGSNQKESILFSNEHVTSSRTL